MQVILVDAPPGFQDRLVPLPLAVEFIGESGPAPDIIILFVVREEALRQQFAALCQRLVATGALWVAWPKKSSKIATDLTFEIVQSIGLETGLVDNKVSAIDDNWTAIRFVIRLKDRQSWRPRQA